MLKLQKYATTPKGVYIDQNNTIHIFQQEKTSLYELLHGPAKVRLTDYMKLTILIHLAKVLNTFHCLKHKTWAHGNLTPHNVFVELPKDPKDIET